MRKHTTKSIAVLLLVVAVIACLSIGLSACSGSYNDTRLNNLADSFSLLMLGNDAFSWNVFSITPEQSYGYVKSGEYEWYSYNKITKADIEDVYKVFDLFYSELKYINFSKLSSESAIKYRSLEYMLKTYLSYYGSDYAIDFSLIGGDYINSQGGYVADFATTVENYAFRNENDVKDLLEITKSTKNAFKTYLNYAADRVTAGYPLYDYTLDNMRGYLKRLIDEGDNYYLYNLIENKINAAKFLSSSKKQTYIKNYKSAIKNNFMAGVTNLYNGLEQYKGHVVNTTKSYMCAYGKIGKEYYTWKLEQKTGLFGIKVSELHNELMDYYSEHDQKSNSIEEYVESIKTTKPTVYSDFQAYMDGSKKLLGLSTPDEVLAYLKKAAKDIVPDLNSTPKIYFREMDSTVAEISNRVAYYLHSPIDDANAPEYITLNPFYTENSDELLLTTIAHEGYPGHLYAYVKAKENGISLISAISSALAFSEGWAVYTEIALLQNIANSTNDEAVKLFCQYQYHNIISSYVAPVISDIRVNYMGYTVNGLVNSGMSNEQALHIVEVLMEDPTLYVSYGYGVCAMLDLHDQAKKALGKKYNEVEFNGVLLSEGSGPTLARAQAITTEYINSKK